ncbi:hypothetical protein [Yunchengibacter salinarum]|uniref:hypothetical protein n=1 Tax=Yunchengibacter salinarum TaxID=3133399 RepID=UPI0035B5E1D8
MTRLLTLFAFASLLAASLHAGGALAHPSAAAHGHPHGASPLAGLEWVLVPVALLAIGWAVWRHRGRK